MRLIAQVTSLDTSSTFLKRFPHSGFFNFKKKSKSGGPSQPDFDLFQKLKKDFDLFPILKEPLSGKRFRSIEEVSNEVT
jgi:hypothetical protein